MKSFNIYFLDAYLLSGIGDILCKFNVLQTHLFFLSPFSKPNNKTNLVLVLSYWFKCFPFMILDIICYSTFFFTKFTCNPFKKHLLLINNISCHTKDSSRNLKCFLSSMNLNTRGLGTLLV